MKHHIINIKTLPTIITDHTHHLYALVDTLCLYAQDAPRRPTQKAQHQRTQNFQALLLTSEAEKHVG